MHAKPFAFVLVGLIAVFCLPTGVHHVKAACQRGQQAGEQLRHLTVNGLRRSYLLHMPSSLDPGTPAAVILAFHPGFATAQGFAENTGLSARAGRAGFVVVYPQGYERSWNAGDCCGPALRQGIDDVAFVRGILVDLVSAINVDPQRIFATGFSNGAKMAYRLACELSEHIAAIAAVGAATSMSDSACRPTRPLPVLHFHSLADRFAPFQGGPAAMHQLVNSAPYQRPCASGCARISVLLKHLPPTTTVMQYAPLIPIVKRMRRSYCVPSKEWAISGQAGESCFLGFLVLAPRTS